MMVVSAAAGVARADGPYPQMVVDRPLVFPAGMSEVDAGVEFPTYLVGLSTHTALGDYHEVDVSVHHAFGALQAGIGFFDSIAGPMIKAGPRWYAGPGTVDIDLGLRVPTQSSGLDHEYTQSLRYTYKVTAIPHVFAAWGGAGLEADEYGFAYDYESPPDGHRIAAVVVAGAELQILNELEVSATITAGVPLSDSMDTKASAAAGAGVSYTIDQFDIYGSMGVGDLRTARLPYASVGVAARFGG